MPQVAVWALLSGMPLAQAGVLTVQVTDPAGKPLADAVVAVQVRGVRPNAAPGTSAEVPQRDRQFTPRVSVVQTGTAVQFPNLDTVRHHVYSFSGTKRFELKLYTGTPAVPVVFDKPGVADLGCNIHDRMRAWIVVVDTPYFAKTDAAGLATLNLPAGEHKLMAWHTHLREGAAWGEQALTLGASPQQASVILATLPDLQ